MKRWLYRVLLCVVMGLALLPGRAHADVPPVETALPQQFIALSAQRLAVRVFELGYGRDLGGGWSGTGLVAVGSDGDGNGAFSTTFGFGVQGLRRLWGTFARGLHAGAEARYEWRGSHSEVPAFSFGAQPSLFRASSDGFSAGAFLAARYAGSTGLFLEGAAGPRWVSSRTVTVQEGATFHESADGFHVLIRVAVGFAW